MVVELHPSFCHQCEAVCGTVIHVEDNRIVKVAPDLENPYSKGFICPKGTNEHRLTDDEDRVIHPLKRQPDGTFAQVGWEDALTDISARLRGIVKAHGGHAVAAYMGNPCGNYASLFLSFPNFLAGLKSPNWFTVGSVDNNNRMVVNQLLYGNPLRTPVPDLPRTQFHFLVGSNPFVSHGSLLTQPRIRDALIAIEKRGGRVVVVDPRRTETAKRFEWLPVRANSDAWMLLSILQVIFAECLEDADALSGTIAGLHPLRRIVEDYPPETTEHRTGIPAEQLRALARDLAAAESLAVHGRCGASLGSYSTVVTYLLDVLVIVTGNLDRPGGSVFPQPAIDLESAIERTGGATYDSFRSRVSGFPEIMGTLPITELAREITTPGDGKVRSLFVGAGNPVMTSPGTSDLAAALEELELFVSFDLYITETNSRAHYILPDRTGMERSDFPIFPMLHSTVPYMQWTKPAVEAPDDTREVGWVLDQICRRAGIAPNPSRLFRMAWRLGIRPSTEATMDLLLRTGRHGDMFGLRRKGARLSKKKLQENPRGFRLEEFVPTGKLKSRLPQRDGRVHVDVPVILEDLNRMIREDHFSAEFPLRLISLRESRSMNSRLHNVEPLIRDRVQMLRMHPDDAATAGVRDGDFVAVVSPRNRLEVPVKVTDEMHPGNIALPHSWGHSGGWRRAVAAGGANFNELAPHQAEDIDRPSGNAWLNGFPVRVEPAAAGKLNTNAHEDGISLTLVQPRER